MFKKQTKTTDPGCFIDYYNDLPDTPGELLQVVQGLVIHGELTKLYGVNTGKMQANEELLRTTEQILGAILKTDPSPLYIKREPRYRFVGMCRDSALLYVSMLRHKGIPARVRVGFANYFQSEILYEDQWVAEYFDLERNCWIRVDTQVDDIQREHYNISFDTKDMPENSGFFLAAEAYKGCREGKFSDGDFGYNKNWKGYQSIKGNLLHDCNCLLGIELLPWDLWTELSEQNWSSMKSSEKNLLEDISDLIIAISKETNDAKLEKQLNQLQLLLPDDYFNGIESTWSFLYQRGEAANIAQTEHAIALIPLNELKTEHFEAATQISDSIHIEGARQNNLKNITLDIPRNKLTVISGVSGSGKSSLAFDTIYAEGRRRYLSGMAQTGDKEPEKPEFDEIKGLTPVIAIEQKKGNLNPRSNVGSLSGITDYLRMLFVTIGKVVCPTCGEELVPHSKGKMTCHKCGKLFSKPNASIFNPNTHQGACHECNGLGYIYEINKEAFIENENLSLLDGASPWWGKLRGRKLTGNWMIGEVFAAAEKYDVDLNLPFKELPEEYKTAILEGCPGETYSYSYNSSGRKSTVTKPSTGAYTNIYRLAREANSEDAPYMRFMKKTACPVCNGEKLSLLARKTTILGWRLPMVTKLSIEDLKRFIYTVEENLSECELHKSVDILKECKKRIELLIDIGLYYLTLERTAPSLSGGELQRLRLSLQLENELQGLTYILDEPSIGLHPKNHQRMIDAMKKLRDKGNTVIVVEHDIDTIKSADYLVDIGPGAGRYGGNLIAAGTVEEMAKNPTSITASYLRASKPELYPGKKDFKKHLVIRGCTANNLKDVTLDLPLNSFTCVTGVSGSGKSSLIFDTLVPAVLVGKGGAVGERNYSSIEGLENLDGVVSMNQAPIGKSSRSVPATYMDILDAIRHLMAATTDAKLLGYAHEKFFSFNAEDGRCKTCEGTGEIKLTFPYMPDKHVLCPDCSGKRFKEEILKVNYNSKNIAEILHMDVKEAMDFFKDCPEIMVKLEALDKVGLSYLHLDQKTSSISGGEAQRLKLAKELCKCKGKRTLYVLDEPTTGLHLSDVDRLTGIFKELVSMGQTVLVVEHNMEMVRSADWIIDMGPEGGVDGGEVIASGTPYEISKNPNSATGRFL